MRRFRQLIPLIFATTLFGFSIFVISQEFRHYSPQEILIHWRQLPLSRQLGAILLTVLGYLVMTGYDVLGFRYIRQSLSFAKIAFTAFISYAIGNTVGFSAFSGTAIRYRFYSSWGISKVSIAKLIVFTHLIFWLGLFFVSGMVFIVDPLTLPSILHLPFNTVHPLGILFLLFVATYFIIRQFWKKPLRLGQEALILPRNNLSFLGVALSALDWGIASTVLYLLLPVKPGISYFGFFGIYILALTAGLISTVPGGLGVFETVILWLKPPSLSSSQVLGALIAYRGIYYLLPLIVALILLLWQMATRRRSI